MKKNILLVILMGLVLVSCGKNDGTSEDTLPSTGDSGGEILYPSEDEILSVQEPSIPSAEGLVKISDVKLIPVDTPLTTGGIVTSIYGDAIGTSVTIQDGIDALLLYGISAKLLTGIKVGDSIEATGTTKLYNGLSQLETITNIISATTTYQPVTSWDITKDWDSTYLIKHGARLVTLKEVSVAGNDVKVLDPGTSTKGSTVQFNIYPNGTAAKGALVYSNWSIGFNELEGIANKYNSMNLNVDTVTITGTLSAHGGVAQVLLNKASDLIIHKGELDLVTSIELSAPNGIEVEATKTLKLASSVLPANSLQDLDWTSSNELIATVDGNGVVKGVSEGNVTITATAKDGTGVNGTIEITVLPAPTYSETTIKSKGEKITTNIPNGSINEYLSFLGDTAIPLEVSFTANGSNAKIFNNGAGEIRLYYTASQQLPGNVLTLTLPKDIHFKNIKLELSDNKGVSINEGSALNGSNIDYDLTNESNVLTIQVGGAIKGTAKAVWIKSLTVIYE